MVCDLMTCFLDIFCLVGPSFRYCHFFFQYNYKVIIASAFFNPICLLPSDSGNSWSDFTLSVPSEMQSQLCSKVDLFETFNGLRSARIRSVN